MPLSPTDFQTDVVHRYFTESCKIFTAYATFINGFPDRHSPLVLYLKLQNIYCIFHKHRRNNSVAFFGFGDGVAGVFGLVRVLKHNRSS